MNEERIDKINQILSCMKKMEQIENMRKALVLGSDFEVPLKNGGRYLMRVDEHLNVLLDKCFTDYRKIYEKFIDGSEPELVDLARNIFEGKIRNTRASEEE